MAQSTGLKAAQMACSATYNRQTGWKTTRTYEGTLQGERLDLTGHLVAAGWEVNVDGIEAGGKVPPKWKITATASIDPQKENPEDTNQDATIPLSDEWELGSNVVEKDLLMSDSPLMVELFNRFGAEKTATSEGFNRAVKELKRFAEDSSYDGDGTFIVYTFEQDVILQNIIAIFDHGGKSERLFLPTLRHTQIVTDKYTVKASQDLCGKILTKNQIGAEGVDDTIKFILPQNLETDRRDSFARNLRWGWLKKFPTVGRQNTNWQISTEYEWGLWHTQLYKFA